MSDNCCVCILQWGIKSNVNPTGLDSKESCVIGTSLFVTPALYSTPFLFHTNSLLISNRLTQKTFAFTLLPSHLPNDGSGPGFWIPWWKWAEDIYIFAVNPLLMCLRPLICLFYLWVRHVGFKGVNCSSVLERQLSAPPRRTHSMGKYVHVCVPAE